MVEHNTELDKQGKRYLPEGMPLSVDRLFDAEKITEDINEWKKETNRMDLRHFDTTDAREPRPKDLIKAITGKTSGEQVLQSEPDRLVGKGVAGERLSRYKKKIRDFESFKSALETSWKGDTSLNNLWEDVKDGKDDTFMEMYNTSVVQKWVMENNYADMISYLMQRYNIERVRAERTYRGLPKKRKESLLNTVIRIRGKVRVVKKKVSQKPQKPQIQTIRQVSRGGHRYSRSKPIRFSENQIEFLRVRQDRPLARIHEEYVSRFPFRTISSLRNKIYRMG